MNIEYNVSASYKNDEERSAIMAKGNMTIRMEPELKAQAAALFKSLGMEAAEKGEDMYGPFDSVADLMEALNA